MHLLLVEDNQDDIDLTLRAFSRSDLKAEVAIARDGQEALDYLFAACERAVHDPEAMPRLVLLDLNLPRLSGLEVLGKLRADPRTCRLPVVILSSSKQDGDIIESYALGANSYVQKPVDFIRFIQTARELGHYWLVLNLSPHPPSSPNS